MLGYRGNPAWRDMSEYVVHFTRDTYDLSAPDTLYVILNSGRLEPGQRPFGAARKLDALVDSQRVVCFSEIPLDRLDRLVERRSSKYGVGFNQNWIVQAGGARVWYVDRDSQAYAAFQELFTQRLHPWNGNDPLWKLTPFVDFPGDYGATSYRFEWEREWRVPSHIEFSPEDVAFLFGPEEAHLEMVERVGSNYTCPCIDPLWPDDRIQEALASMPIPDQAAVTIPTDEADQDCPYCAFYPGDVCPACGQLVLS
jgi:Putative abortive phage resistance protein AbiGi, antitoxin